MSQPVRWVVLKFGGTSVSRRNRWDTIGRLAAKRVGEEGVRVLVVVSALSGVTNELQAIAYSAVGENFDSRIDALVERHRAFCAELDLDPDAVLGPRLEALRALANDPRAKMRELSWQADVLAQGELLSSTLGAAYLRSQGLDFGWSDAREWLDAVSLPNASPWAQRLSVNCRCAPDAALQARFDAQPAPMLVTQGFIARHADGGTAILGRGGSDTSAAYFGALLGALRVEIWTDVPGMFSANPRDVPDARLLTRLDYAEAQEIATTGAKVLHPRSIAPCRDGGVPITILDTERPDLPGTRIDASAATVPGVKAISRRNGIVLVSMESIGMWQQVGFLADVFERFKRNGLSVDLIGSSETNVTVSLDPEREPGDDQRARSPVGGSRRSVPREGHRAVRGDHARRPRHALAAAQVVGCVGDVRPGTRAPDLAVVERSQPHVRRRRSRRRRHAAATARRTDPWRRDAGAGRRRCSARAGATSRTASRCAARRGGWASATRCSRSPRSRHAALRLRSGDRARPRARTGRHRCDRPPLLRDQGQSASGDPAHAGRRRLRPGMRVAWANSSTCSPRAGVVARARAVHAELRAAQGIRSGVRDGRDGHARQRRSAASLAGSVPRPHDLAAPGPRPRRRPPREGQHRRRRREVRPAARSGSTSSSSRRASSACASAACTRTSAAASTIRAIGAACMPNSRAWPTASAPSNRSTSAAACRVAVHAGCGGLRPRRVARGAGRNQAPRIRDTSCGSNRAASSSPNAACCCCTPRRSSKRTACAASAATPA